MSRTALVVVGIIALALGAIFVIVRNSPPGAPSARTPGVSSPLQGIDQARIDAIRITPVDGPPAILTRTAGGASNARWSLELDATRWPADPSRVLDLLRTLDASASPPGSAAKAADDAESALVSPIVLEITAGAQTTTVRVATTPLAGTVALESSNGFAGVAPTSLLHLLTKPGPASWRLTTPFPGLEPAAATHLTLVAHDQTIELARLDKRWRVVRPIAARANPVVVDDALAHVGAYAITSFLSGDNPPANAGLDNPALTLTLARDTRPRAGAQTPTDQRTIAFGAPLPGAATWYASIDRPHPVTVELTGPPPTSFSTAVRNYLATTATDVAPADVGAIRLTWKDGTSRTLARKLDAWVEKPDDTPADAEPIDAALAFLHDEPAEPQESFVETDVRTLLRVELLDFADAPLDVLNVGYNADAQLTVRAAAVLWLYASYRGPALFNLPDFNDLPPEPGLPPPPERADEYPTK